MAQSDDICEIDEQAMKKALQDDGWSKENLEKALLAIQEYNREVRKKQRDEDDEYRRQQQDDDKRVKELK